MDLKECCNVFFKKYDGEISYWERRKYYIKGKLREGILFYVGFKNLNIFGNGSFKDEIFPRYRHMMMKLNEYLDNCNSNSNNYVLDMVPILESKTYLGNAYEICEKEKTNNSDLEIVPIPMQLKNELTLCKNSIEVCRIIKRVKDNHYYGIDEVLYYVICEILKEKRDLKLVMDIGAASGNAARIYINRGNIREIFLVDSNKQICTKLQEELGILAAGKNTILNIENKDCLECNIPEKLDVLSITVDTDAVISFLYLRQEEIKRALGDEGIFVVELLNCIGKKGYSFVNELVLGESDCFMKWSWYKYVTPVNRLFLHNKIIRIDNEVLILCSNNEKSIQKIAEIVNKKRGENYDL